MNNYMTEDEYIATHDRWRGGVRRRATSPKVKLEYPWSLDPEEPNKEDHQNLDKNEEAGKSHDEGGGGDDDDDDDDDDDILRLESGVVHYPPCGVCGWSGRLDQIATRTYLLDKEHSATTLMLQEQQHDCLSCAIILKCLDRADCSFDGTTIQFLTSPLTPVGSFFKILGDEQPPFQFYSLKIAPTSLIRAEDSVTRLGVHEFRGISGDTSSTRAAQFILSSLRSCWNLHKTCRMSTADFLPSRLIDVKVQRKGNRDVVLVNTKDLDRSETNYAALSHCWGKVNLSCCTTPETYGDRTTRITWETLPQTFKDAVEVTRRLELRYIWIDSLCIVQGDSRDWQHESGKMFDVFANATITLAAVHSPDSSGGLFSRTEKSELRPLVTLAHDVLIEEEESKLLGIDSSFTRTVTLPLHVRRSLPRFHTWKRQDLPMRAPLFDRAWAYQERLVAPRVLYFTEHELLWECFEESSCECTGESHFEGPKRNHMRAVKVSDCHERWRDVVTEYSRLDLTLEVDKFPAVSAVAVQIQQARPGVAYLAGLWYDTLPIDLIWRATDPSLGRPSTNIAPSWSWASVKSGVEYPIRVGHPLATVVDVRCSYPTIEVPTTESPYSANIIRGQLTLQGSLVEFGLRRTQPRDCSWFLVHGGTDAKFRLFPDSTANELVVHDDHERVYALALIKNLAGHPKTCVCLVLRKDDQLGIYSRIGILINMQLAHSTASLKLETVFEKFGSQSVVQIE